MQKYIFLLPLYNDWESLTLLLTKINEEIKSKNKIADILVINDCSTVLTPTFFSLSNINKINILNLKSNLGSQKAISVGLKYLKKKDDEMIITILDSDGEDDKWYAIQVMVLKKDTGQIMDDLSDLGATGILVMEIKNCRTSAR